jgi:hypothetical protein
LRNKQIFLALESLYLIYKKHNKPADIATSPKVSSVLTNIAFVSGISTYGFLTLYKSDQQKELLTLINLRDVESITGHGITGFNVSLKKDQSASGAGDKVYSFTAQNAEIAKGWVKALNELKEEIKEKEAERKAEWYTEHDGFKAVFEKLGMCINR